MMIEDDKITTDMLPMEIFDLLIEDTEIPQEIKLPSTKYRVYSKDENTAGLVTDVVRSCGYTNTVLAFRLYYSSKTAPKGIIKFISTGLFMQWSRWVKKIQERKATYGDKWYEGMTTKHIEMLREDLTYQEVYYLITDPIRQEALDADANMSEVDILEHIKEKFHNRIMDRINDKYSDELRDLLLLFPECPDHYVNMSPEFKHLNDETFTFIKEIKEEALKYYMYKELA